MAKAEEAMKNAEETVNVTKGEYQELIRLLTVDTAEKLREKDEAKRRQQAAKDALRKSLMESAAAQDAFQRGCSHKKEDGTFSTGGQANNDGKISILCLKCHKVWRLTPSPVNLEAIRRGDLSLAGIEPPREAVVSAEALVA